MKEYKMINIAICFNSISYTIAKNYAYQNDKKLIILYDKIRTKTNKEDHRELKLFSLQKLNLYFFGLLSYLGFVETVLIPHQRQNRKIKRIVHYAKKVEYIDDGLDTLRNKPKNFFNYSHNFTYYTFKEYSNYGTWLNNKNIVSIASLKELINLEDTKESFSLPKGAILIIESPGIIPKEIYFENKSNFYLFRHPVKDKQIDFGHNIHVIDSNIYSVEKTIDSLDEGNLVFGETMSFVIFLLISNNNKFNVNLFLNNSNNLSVITSNTSDLKNIKQFFR